jgi:SAM-dependent methyltransferase
MNPESRNIIEIAQSLSPNPHDVTKPISYYKIYQEYFRPYAGQASNILEIGVYQGESLKILSRFFPEALVLGLDLDMKTIDFTAFPNVRYEQADQTNPEALTALADKHAPNGFDIIIDDASHIGAYSVKTFEALFPKLKSGGLYIVEDWGTGYWKDWPDGGTFEKFQTTPLPDTIVRRIPSHDFGMVGFVKSLVDLVHIDSVRHSWKSQPLFTSTVEYIHYYPGVVILKKL